MGNDTSSKESSFVEAAMAPAILLSRSIAKAISFSITGSANMRTVYYPMDTNHTRYIRSLDMKWSIHEANSDLSASYNC